MTSTARSRSKRGIVVRLLTGLAVIFGLTVAVAGPASAHHPTVTGGVDCYGKATFTSVSWATGSQGANNDIDIYYSTNNGSSWTYLDDGAYTSSNNYRFTGSVNIGSATQVKFKAYANAKWGNNAAGGQTTYSPNYPAPTDCDQSKSSISYDCEKWTASFDNSYSKKDIAFDVYVNGVKVQSVTVKPGDKGTATGRVEDGKKYTVEVKVGTKVKDSKTFTVDCKKPSATFQYDCTTWSATLVNPKSVPVTFVVTINGQPTPYTVPAGETVDIDGRVNEGTSYTVTITDSYTTYVDEAFTVDCQQDAQPTASFAYDCDSWDATLDNTKSTVPVTFTVTVNGQGTPYEVPAGQSTPLTGAVVEDQAYTVTIVGNGTTFVNQSFTVDCVTPPPPPPVTPPPPPNDDDDEPEVEGVQASGKAVGNLKVTCQGTVRVVMKNKSSSRAVYTVKVAKKSTKIAVKADSNKRWETTGKPKQVAKLMLGKKVLAQKKLPTPCRKPDVLPNTGKKPLGSAARSAAPTLSVPSLGVNAAIQSTGLTARGALAVGPSVTKVYSWRNGVKPGQRGSAVIAGHTYSRGAGVFDNLGKLSKGDRFTAGKATFKVTRVQKVRGLSQRQVAGLFSDRGKARAVLVTCGDRTADGIYHSRILVFADKV